MRSTAHPNTLLRRAKRFAYLDGLYAAYDSYERHKYGVQLAERETVYSRPYETVPDEIRSAWTRGFVTGAKSMKRRYLPFGHYERAERPLGWSAFERNARRQ